MEKKTRNQKLREKAEALALAKLRFMSKYDPALCELVIAYAEAGKMPLLSVAAEKKCTMQQLKNWRKQWPEFGAACDIAESIYCSSKIEQYESDMRAGKANGSMWQHYAKSHLDRILYPEDAENQNLVVNIIKPKEPQ